MSYTWLTGVEDEDLKKISVYLKPLGFEPVMGGLEICSFPHQYDQKRWRNKTMLVHIYNETYPVFIETDAFGDIKEDPLFDLIKSVVQTIPHKDAYDGAMNSIKNLFD